MHNFKKIEADLLDKYQNSLNGFLAAIKHVGVNNTDTIGQIKIKFQAEGTKHSGGIYKFGSLTKSENRIKLEVWQPTYVKPIYKALHETEYFSSIELMGSTIFITPNQSTGADKIRHAKFIDAQLQNLEIHFRHLKKVFNTYVKQEFKNDSKDTIQSLNVMGEEMHQKLVKQAKAAANEAKNKLDK